MTYIHHIILSFFIISNIYGQGQSTLVPEIEVTSDQYMRPSQDSQEDESFYLIESTDLIKAKDLQTKNVDHVSELLQSIPGVSVVGGSSPQFRKITIRGMEGLRVIQKVDGARRYEQTQFSLSSDTGIEAESLKEVRVRKGAESLTSASGAIGGAVQYTTIDPSDLLKGNKDTATKAKVSYSSATKSIAQTITTAAKVAKKTAILLQAIWRDIDRTQEGGDEGQTSELNYKRESYMGKVENKSFLGKFVAKASYTTTENNETSYRSGSDDATSDYFDKTVEGTINHTYNSQTNPYINLKNNLYINRRESTKDTHTPWRGFESTVGITEDILDQLGGQLTNRSVFALNDHHFIESEFGLSYAQIEAQEKTTDGEVSSYFGTSNGEDLGLFTMNNINLFNDTIILKAGARINDYKRSAKNLAINVKDSNGSTFSNVLGVTLKPLPFVDVFAKMSNSNRAPEVRELYLGGGLPFACHFPRKICSDGPNADLEEETAFGRELGINLHHKNTFLRTNFKVSYFYEKVNDYIERMPTMYRLVGGEQVMAGPRTATHRDYKYTNLNKVLRSGIEAALNVGVSNFNFGAKYSAMNMDCELCPEMFTATTVSEPLYTAPADKLVATVDYTFNRLHLNIGYRGEFVDSQERLSLRYRNAGFATPGYSVHSAFVGWEPTFAYTGRFRLDFALENFTNKKYQVHNSGTGAFELGQNFKMSLNKFF